MKEYDENLFSNDTSVLLLTNPKHFLASLFYFVDKHCRNELKVGTLVSERDYVTAFLQHTKYPFGIINNANFSYSQTLPQTIEQKYGVDAIIILKYKEKYHIGVFEAKVLKTDYPMDNIYSGATKSRFTEQLEKQAKINDNIFVWEMLFHGKYDEKTYFDEFGSTCIERKYAASHSISKSRQTWTFSEFKKVCIASYKKRNNRPLNIYEIILKMLDGTLGKGISPSNDGIMLFKEREEETDNISDIKENFYSIPIIKSFDQIDIHQINQFLIWSKINNYVYFDLDSLLGK